MFQSRKKAENYRVIGILLILPALLFFFLGFVSSSLVAYLVAFLFFISSLFFFGNYTTWGSGAKGEEKVAEYLNLFFNKTIKIIKRNKGLVISSIFTILVLLVIVSEDGFLSLSSPIPRSGYEVSIYTPEDGEPFLRLSTYRYYPNTGYSIVTRKYWTGNVLYVKMVGVKRTTEGALLVIHPAQGRVGLEGIPDGSYQVIFFWIEGLLNVKVESYKLVKSEGNLSIERIESNATTVFLANMLYLTPWLLLCLGLLFALIFLFRIIYRKISQKTTSASNVITQPT